MLSELALAWRFARRDLRGGAAGLPTLVGCLALGVAATGGIGSLSASVRAGLAADARVLLGGDAALSRPYRALAAEERAWVAARAAASSETVGMRAMAEGPDGRALVELKAVDSAYPLLGAMTLDPPGPLAAALADGGAVADPALLARLGFAVGDTAAVGDARFVLRAAIVDEPDRIASAFNLGPRLMVAAADLPATGLLRPGAVTRRVVKLTLPPDLPAADFARGFEAAFPESGWRVRRADEAQPGLRRFIERLGLYLALVGLSALLVGGVGIAGSARALAESRLGALAALKALGAAPATLFRIVMLETAAVALAGIALGTAAGAALPFALAPLLADRLDLAPAAGIYPAPLALAAACGALTAALFALAPLARASRVSAGGLFRHRVEMPEGPPPRAFRAAAAALAVLLALLVVAGAGDWAAGAWFAGGAAGGMAALALAGRGVARAARRLAGACSGLPRIALSSLGRPGGTAPSAVPALGIGLAVLVAVALAEANMRRMVDERLRADAPAFFLIDVQRDQAEPLAALAASLPGVGEVERAPMLRGRLIAINGAAVGARDLTPEARWLAGDIGLSFAARPPPGTRLAAGAWWPPEYDGPALLSFDEESALDAGLGIGDRVTFSVLGRPVEAEIANLRRVAWSRIALNFVAVFSPGALAAAPHTLVATVQAEEAAEAPLVRALADGFANVSAVPVRETLAAAGRVVRAAAGAIGLVAAAALAAGVLVLAGAVAAERRARVRDAAVLKALGATRSGVLAAWLLEFALLGAAAGAVALVLGGLAAWGFVAGLLEIEWTFPAGRALAAVALGAALAAALGLAGSWRALGRKPAPILRTP